jgi:acetyl-CoA carboxylase carboxyltransferase component
MADGVKFENGLGSKMDLAAPRVKANREALMVLMAALRVEEDSIRLGGGAEAAEKQHAKRRLTVRERLALLLDPVETGSVSNPPFAKNAKDGAPVRLWLVEVKGKGKIQGSLHCAAR